jgi:hypothetical protein
MGRGFAHEVPSRRPSEVRLIGFGFGYFCGVDLGGWVDVCAAGEQSRPSFGFWWFDDTLCGQCKIHRE